MTNIPIDQGSWNKDPLEDREHGQSEATRPREYDPRQSQPISRTLSARLAAADPEYVSPFRRTSALDETGDLGTPPGIRRRSSLASRRSGASGVPSLAPQTTLAERTQGNFTLAGPDETAQMRLAHEPFVHPVYTALNPSYEQAANTKPLWSLAKPLPRVVRSGMVPTREELLENRVNAQAPAANSQRLGLDVDPNDLEQGRIAKAADPRKMAAQVEDARQQRENNLISKLLSSGDGASAVRQSSRLDRASSSLAGRVSAGDVPSADDQLPSSPLAEKPKMDGLGAQDTWPTTINEDLLHPVPEEPETTIHLSDDEESPEDDVLGLHESVLPDDLHPLVQELVEDEVHNHHTTWSVIRSHHREALAESLAVFVQLTIGFCADLSVTVAEAENYNTTQWAWGFATMIGIYISGGISGGHLNPVITLVLWFYRGFPKRKIPEYLAAQFLGAFCAGLTAYGLYYQSIEEHLRTHTDVNILTSFLTNQRQPWIQPVTAFFNEFLGTAFLSITVLALGDDQNAPPGAGMNSLILGLVITCLTITFGFQTGAGFNPSRDFGPRLALLALGYGGQLFTNPYWFYGPWAGALTGAFFGAFLYDFMIFTGGESPVNYPMERTQRAMRKSRMKWKRRLHLPSKKMKDDVVQ
ncbi:hypothetical protein FE257_008559 [Aspergillus nanangensis]|uniref:MIP transporter n=1 Tax=Aspergillus nanangensis TaxID=2582783 RepID=A0AAD4GTE8_ASPNN|nr:hypothetical protein FE257_008559 [Aspergillus nanangensis]